MTSFATVEATSQTKTKVKQEQATSKSKHLLTHG